MYRAIMSILFVSVVFLSAVTFAQPKKNGMFRERMAERLGLTEEQKSKIGDLRSKFQKDMIDLKGEVEKLQIEKRELVRKGSLDRKAFLDLEERLVKSHGKMRMAHAAHKMDVYGLMTAEQKEKIAKWADKFFDGKGPKGKPGRRMPMGMGPKGKCCPPADCERPMRRR